MGRFCGFWPNIFKFFTIAVIIMRKSKQILILGTSTDIGKTFLTCELIAKSKKQNEKLKVVKPLISGFNRDDENCDTVKIIKHLGINLDEKNIEAVSPFRLKDPLSPLTAAKNEGKEISYNEVLNFCREQITESRSGNFDLIIESAGGLMTPICIGKTFLDLAQDLGIEIYLVGACFLGGISATLSAYENLTNRQCKNITILISDHLEYDRAHLKISDFLSEIKNFADCDVFLVENFIK